jgi:capsular polysaccharide biosynthesis protein
VDLNGYLSILRRQWWAVVVGVAIALVIAIALTATTEKTYRASARMFVNIPAAADLREALQGVQLSSQLLESYAAIATSRTSAEAISKELGGDVSPGEVRARLTAEPQPDTLLLDLVVLDTDRERGRRIADAAAATLTRSIKDLGPTPERSVEARLVDPAAAGRSPVSPRPVRNLGAALVLGLGFGVLFAFLLDALAGASGTPTPAAATTPHAAPPSDEVLRVLTSLEQRVRTLGDAVDELHATAVAPRPPRRARTTADKPPT